MTPEELRLKSWSELESAQALLGAGKPDQAARHANLVVELALKARFCTQNRIADLPANPKKMRQLLQSLGLDVSLRSHELDKLLTLAGGDGLKPSTLLHVDWDRALAWFDDRYTSDGLITKEDAAAQIQESGKLFATLALFECVDVLQLLADEWEKTFGLFNLVALCEDQSIESWVFLLSAHWLRGTSDPRWQRMFADLEQRLPKDLKSVVRQMRHLVPGDQLVRCFHAYPRVHNAKQTATSHNLVFGVMMPAAYVITNLPYTEEQVRTEMTGRGHSFEPEAETPPSEETK